MGDRTLDFVALGVLCFVVVTIIYGVIYIHDIPYEIAKKRKHPHQDAIHTAGWVSLFLMHTIWPFLWIWATLYKPETGWGLRVKELQETAAATDELRAKQVEELKARIADMELESKKQQALYARHLQQLNSRLVKLEAQSAEKREG
ncbi:DUF3302 domain-containing protein [Desulfosediminicola flagellatus]|uniref:DUF3302 domain-containing protein n=1 Tax=Desulfosediminicola flagellatus TaxID=2569541 RepID=UPI0010AB6F91|nr:DUF3302 domain-containing protein [Desulfosediminicola flagellatus]